LLEHEVVVAFTFSGTAPRPASMADPKTSITIPAGKASVEIPFTPEKAVPDGATAVLALEPGDGYHIGCPSAAMVVIQK
jgi:hypothetical protein